MEQSATIGGATGSDACYGDSSAHAIKCSYNNGTFGQVVLDTATQTLTNKTITLPTITSGVAADGSGFKHKRFASPLGGGCPTGTVIGNTCTSANLNWTSAFADNSYTVSCTLDSPTNQPHIVNITKLAAGAGITITIATDLASPANAGAECIAVHD